MRARRSPAWIAIALLAATAACTHPPPPLAPAPGGGTAVAPAPGCDGPVLPDAPAACVEDAPRPPQAPVAARPGDDRDGDGVEDLLDVCPDEPAPVDADEDGCPDR